MSAIKDILLPSCTRAEAPASSRKRVMEFASELLGPHLEEVDPRTLFDGLMARERLGSTAVGEGIALPHCRLPGCRQASAALLHLDAPVDFEAPDGEPVDLVFVLVVPEDADEDHLRLLAAAAEAFNDAGYRAALREAVDDEALFESATRGPGQIPTAAASS